MKLAYRNFAIILLGVSLLISCKAVKNANNKQKGAVIGAAGGAVIGGVIGNNVGDKDNSVLGAIIGGVVGGAAGAYIGDRMDRQAERIEEELPGAEVKRVGEGINVTFDESSGVYFATNKANVNSSSSETLDKMAGIFKDYPKTNIIVEGHTDNTGDDTYNLDLSQRRAQSVVNYLASKGVDRSRFTIAWYGEGQPKYDNSTVSGRAKNRRVELGIIANEALKKEALNKTKG
ncbi:OmpA family protein [Sungkyunkwania multivorans]|uniref:OmpA family protein n=1 Tax=Sungkyunkwania multivorans TaxID=1173618 RepID=A0ABW3CZH5_9FLAO